MTIFPESVATLKKLHAFASHAYAGMRSIKKRLNIFNMTGAHALISVHWLLYHG